MTAVFENALNLPERAKVKFQGADIGEVESIRAQNFTAQVKMRIRPEVRIPAGVTAELRSATPLGDLFVAIQPDPAAVGAVAVMDPGGTIDVPSTSGGATIEEVLSSAALLVNGGVVRNLTALVNGAGAAVGGRGTNVAELLQRTNTLVTRLNDRSAEIRTVLESTSALASTVAARQDSLNSAIAVAGPATNVLADNTGQLIDLTTTVARVTAQLGRFPSLQGADTRSLIADINRLSEAFNEVAVDPELSITPLNRVLPIILDMVGSTSLRGTADVVRIALGSLPDMNYPGDPMMHGPDGTDWHSMVASLRYEWNLLLDKIYGPRQ
ncbi:MlaD family protein [[Mycobacterium] wendilense]|uniref:MlaD family protein n=1 Tax=[Mycobacterium] wendilense TaxID=3064284 RepID=A0ABN9P4E9_9MYCO|nr:MlaD family protein [Mycolicibacterium sp. MU0050]CAJ1586828.1 MlaD family protein [Mycolicibacterium sp. MU0050]